MTQDEKIMTELIEFAYDKTFNHNAYPFCAFVVKDGAVVSRGYNSSDNPYLKSTNHGEMVAIKRAARALRQLQDLSGYSLYTTCEPCLACFDMCLWMNISKIVYSIGKKDFQRYFNDHPYNITDYLKDKPDHIKVLPKILHEEGYYLFRTAQRKYGW